VTPETADIAWIKSTKCTSGTCVEAAKLGELYLIRDSKNPDQPALQLGVDDWRGFLEAIQAGDYR
jgi:hypothetical protein